MVWSIQTKAHQCLKFHYTVQHYITYTCIYLFNEVHTLGGLYSICIVDDVWNVVALADLSNFNNPTAVKYKSRTVY